MSEAIRVDLVRDGEEIDGDWWIHMNEQSTTGESSGWRKCEGCLQDSSTIIDGLCLSCLSMRQGKATLHIPPGTEMPRADEIVSLLTDILTASRAHTRYLSRIERELEGARLRKR